MDSSVSGKDEIWFLRVYHHVPHVLYQQPIAVTVCQVLKPENKHIRYDSSPQAEYYEFAELLTAC